MINRILHPKLDIRFRRSSENHKVIGDTQAVYTESADCPNGGLLIKKTLKMRCAYADAAFLRHTARRVIVSAVASNGDVIQVGSEQYPAKVSLSGDLTFTDITVTASEPSL